VLWIPKKMLIAIADRLAKIGKTVTSRSCLDKSCVKEMSMRSSLKRPPLSRKTRWLRASHPRLEELESRVVPSGSQFAFPLVGVPQDIPGLPPATITPSQMKSAYGINQVPWDGTGQTIALIEAFNQPNIISDLATFDSKYGIAAPPSIKLVNQNGGSSLPAANKTWGQEISLDVEWAHAIAPGANLVVVEALNSSAGNLFTAANTAATKEGASVASMSFGFTEFSSETSYDADLSHSGVTYVAAAGDSGAPAIYPSASPNVLSVGGTSLTQTNGTYKSEKVWNHGILLGETGGAPSTIELEPSWQNGFQNTGFRGTADVAFDADPFTGVSIYDSYKEPGWLNGVGGTSLSAPSWAGIIALANQGRVAGGAGTLSNLPADIYSLSASDFHDITVGKNNKYSAMVGYDFPTGRGTPIANLLIPDLIALASRAQAASSNASGASTVTAGNPLGRAVALLESSTPNGLGLSTTSAMPSAGTAGSAAAAVQGANTGALGSTNVGVSVGGAVPALSAGSSFDVWRAHSLPDSDEVGPPAPDNQQNAAPANAPPVQPPPIQAPAIKDLGAGALEIEAAESVFSDGSWQPLPVPAEPAAPGASAPSIESTLDHAALGSVLLLGASWWSLTAEAEKRQSHAPQL
jgi:hypothetical protein